MVDDDPDIPTLIEQSLYNLSDIRVSGMNGYEFVRNAKEIDKQVKVVFMSAFEINDKEFHNMLPDIKVDAFLQKPFSIQQLNNIVEKLM